MRIVADAAIPHLDEMLGEVAQIERHPGRNIDASTVRDADALLVRSVTRVDDGLVAGSALRFVGSATAGTDHVDRRALAERDIAFAHAPGCNAPAVVQYVTTALYWLAHRRDPSLFSRPIGIVGFGQVGSRLAARLRGLGHEVLANDPPLAAGSGASEAFASLDELFSRCGVMTLHVPLTTARESTHPTAHLLDAERVRSALAAGTHLINTSRGGVLDERPLLEQSSARGCAVLDVWEHEPRLRWGLLDPDSPVALATPHVAGYSLEGKRTATRMVAEQLGATMGLRVAPLPPAPTLAGEIVADDAMTAAIAQVMLRACDLEADDASVRALLELPEPERPAAFEALRSGYRLRREQSAWTVRAEDPHVRAVFEAAGFLTT